MDLSGEEVELGEACPVSWTCLVKTRGKKKEKHSNGSGFGKGQEHSKFIISMYVMTCWNHGYYTVSREFDSLH